jgi:hypothetical protein
MGGELEETDKVMEPRVQSSSFLEDVTLRAKIAGDLRMSLILLDLQMTSAD